MACPATCGCTNPCRDGLKPFTYSPEPCSHVFPYWSVLPPTHCPKCGADLRPKCGGCGGPLPPTPFRATWTTNTTSTSKV